MRGRRWSLVGRLSRKCRHSGDQREAGIRRRAGLPRAFGALRSRLGRASKSGQRNDERNFVFLWASLYGSTPFGLSGRPALHAHSHRINIATTGFSSE
jgi:hypothetical protein